MEMQCLIPVRAETIIELARAAYLTSTLCRGWGGSPSHYGPILEAALAVRLLFLPCRADLTTSISLYMIFFPETSHAVGHNFRW